MQSFCHSLPLVLVGFLVWVPLAAVEPNTLSSDEKSNGFELLFDGTSFKGWKQKGNWKIEGDAMSRADSGGGLIYMAKKIPDNFELRFDWKVVSGSNSGVYYRPGQYEYQILDNAVHIDGRNPRTSAASLYFCMAPSDDATKPVGEWNVGKVICKGTIIQHWLNGKKVVHFDYKDPKWKANVELLRLRGGKLAARGAHLSLQDHGDPVWYRNIKLRTLSEHDKVDEKSVEPAVISEEVRKAEQEKLTRILERRKKKS